ncbi:YcgL domain-containing protein [Cellvibrio polysaccharolyticus]|uniref:YcgL domain-containing protein C4F51_13105 n=1 Tax=Cellvibrio polysaccharolyticus TaxID=2082724 RepID=A0A928V3J8_9GAMM|nr:YcgL domain-containing protein [Cellvibrio polysaccharolyticus]MBE8718126.1 YcgL domain-containing protein [Cellvibrio polysaccharolyticus]
MKVITEIFRSAREEGMYLYVRKDEGLSRVPEELLKRFGKPVSAMVLLLTPERKLARVPTASVLKALQEQGFYLQLPPAPGGDQEMWQVRSHNSKLSG